MADQSPLITTVIPTYRQAKMVTRAIKSALAQKFTNIRVLVCDNASEDNTESVVRAIAAADPRVAYHRQPQNIGMIGNFNTGLQMVDTPFYSLLSDDDILLPDFYQVAMEQLQKHPDAIFAATRVFRVDQEGRVLDEPMNTWPRLGYFTPPEGVRVMYGSRHPTLTGILFRREAISLGRLFDERVAMFSDLGLIIRLAASRPFVACDVPGGLYVFHPESMGQGHRGRQIGDIWPGLNFIIQRLKDQPGIAEDLREEIEKYYRHLFSLLMHEIVVRNSLNCDFAIASQAASLIRREGCQLGMAFMLDAFRHICRVWPARKMLLMLQKYYRNILARRLASTPPTLAKYMDIEKTIGEYPGSSESDISVTEAGLPGGMPAAGGQFTSLGVCIPTRNRASLAITAIQSLLSQGVPAGQLQILVSDNSTDSRQSKQLADFIGGLGVANIQYVRPEQPLAMTAHWNWMADQMLDCNDISHMTILTDRMIFKNGAITRLLKLICRRPDETISYNQDRINDWICPVVYESNRDTGLLLKVRSREFLRLVSQGFLHPAFPRVLNSVSSREVFERIRQRFGSIFASASPDFQFTFRLLATHEHFFYLDRSLITHYGMARSNGAGFARGVMSGDNKDFVATLGGDSPFACSPLPDIPTVENAIFHEYCTVMKVIESRTFPPIDPYGYARTLAMGVAAFQDDTLRESCMKILRDRYGYTSDVPFWTRISGILRRRLFVSKFLPFCLAHHFRRNRTFATLDDALCFAAASLN